MMIVSKTSITKVIELIVNGRVRVSKTSMTKVREYIVNESDSFKDHYDGV